MVGSLDTDLLTRYSRPVAGMALTGRVSSDSTRLQRKQPPETREKILARSNGRTDLLTRYSRLVGGMAPTGRLCRVLSIPRDSIKNSLRKLVKNI